MKKPKQVQQILEPWMQEELRKCKADPIYFISNYIWVKPGIKFEPYDLQIKMIEAIHKNSNTIIMLCRQAGKTQTSAAYLLWYGMFVKNSDILVVGNNGGMAQEIMHRILMMYESVPWYIKDKRINDAKTSIEFRNKSRIVSRATTPNSGRGLSPALLLADEFAILPPKLQAEFYSAILPTLAQTRGKMIICSTPYTDSDTFSTIWRGAERRTDEQGNPLPDEGPGSNGFKSLKATWEDVPGRDKEWERTERLKMMDDAKFDREYNCLFAGYSDTLIDSKILTEIKDEVIRVKPIFKTGEVRWYKEIERSKTYLVALDPAMGGGGDDAAIQIFEAGSMTQVGEWMSNKTPIPHQIRILKGILSFIAEVLDQSDPDIYWTVENNTLGEAVLICIQELGEENFHGTFLSEPDKSMKKRSRKGFNTSNRSKLTSCSKLKALVEKRKITLSSQELVRQLSYFVASGASYEAKVGERDDLVSSTLLIIRMLAVVMRYDDEISDNFKEKDDEEMLFYMMPTFLSNI